MSKSAVILFAYGFEEVEALTVYDGLVRAGVKVVKLAVGGNLNVVSSHGVEIVCDDLVENYNDVSDLIYVPGGMPGSTNIAQCWSANELIIKHAQDRLVSAICAAAWTSAQRKGNLLPRMRGLQSFCQLRL